MTCPPVMRISDDEIAASMVPMAIRARPKTKESQDVNDRIR